MGFFDRLLGRNPHDAEQAPHDAAPGDDEAGTAPLDPAQAERASVRITEIQEDLARGTGEGPALHEELGGLHEQLGDPLAAIDAYETSLAEQPRYGHSYNRLMDLYNTQRSEAAAAGDGDAINQWMSKIDELLATSKRIMRETY